MDSFVRALKPCSTHKTVGLWDLLYTRKTARSCLSELSVKSIFLGPSRTTTTAQARGGRTNVGFVGRPGRARAIKGRGISEQQSAQRQQRHASAEQLTPVALRTVRVVFSGLDLFVSLASRLFATVSYSSITDVNSH